MADDALSKLRTNLEQDPVARKAFADDLKSLLKRQGLDPEDSKTLKELGIEDLDVNRPGFAARVGRSTVVVTIVM